MPDVTINTPNPTVTIAILEDDFGNPITGATWTDGGSIDPNGSAWPVDPSSFITNVSSNIYRLSGYSFPSVGEWLLVATPNGDDALNINVTFNVVAASSAGGGAIPVIGGLTLTRRTLRRRIAARMGDVELMHSTAPSLSASTFIDALNVNAVAEQMAGRMMLVATGANTGHLALIQSKDSGTSTLTFTPPAPNLFGTGDEIEIVNSHGRGFKIPEYNQAINDAINDAWPKWRIDYVYAVPDAFDVGSPRITIPDEMSFVYELQWLDASGAWIPIRKGKWYGWRTDPAMGQVSILGDISSMVNGKNLRVFGYGRHPELATDTDLCSVPAEWLVARAAYHLSLAGVDKEQAKAQSILTFQREAEMLTRKIVRNPRPTTERVH